MTRRSRQPVVSVDQMRRIDEAAIHQYQIPRLLLMDHAGQAVARVARSLLVAQPASRERLVTVCCGTGFNGGDGLCAAWHLIQAGVRVWVCVAGRVAALRGEAGIYAAILRALRIPIQELQTPGEAAALATRLRRSSLIIDALLGIGLRGDVRPLQTTIITAINRAGRPVVAVDVPSGLDADSGQPMGCAVYASVTVTFGCAKPGFRRARRHVGRVRVVDIGLPQSLLLQASPLAPRRHSA